MKEKILIVADATTPNQGARGVQAYKLIRLLNHEFNTYIITSTKAKNKEWFKEHIEDGNIFYIKHNHNNLVNKAVKQFFTPVHLVKQKYIKQAVNICELLLKKSTFKAVLCFSINFSNAIVGVQLKKRNRDLNIIQFFSDPIINNPYNERNILEKAFYFTLNKKIYNGNFKIVVPSKKMQYNFEKQGFERVSYIPHSFSNQQLKRKTTQSKFIIGYFGSLNQRRNPLELLTAINDAQEFVISNKFQFVFYGNISKKLKSIMRNNYHFREDEVIFNKSIPYKDVQDKIMNCDALLVIDAPIQNSLFAPSKLFEYMAFKKPILAISPNCSETTRLIKEIGQVQIDNSELGISLIRKLTEIKEICINEQKYNQYEGRKVINKWIEIINN